ncbi:MAG: efflux RND transporter periplasmic adaptor subunit [Bacillota bacterium]
MPTSQTMKAGRSDIEVRISGTGTVTVDSRASVTAGTSGTVEKLGFKVGDTVKKGQVLVVFEWDDVSGQIDQIELNMKKQKLQMTQYETQYKEATGTEKEADTKQSIENSMELLKLEIEQNEQSLSELYEQKSDTAQVVAPINGTITASDISVGSDVQGNVVLAEIVNYTALSFVVQVDELEIPLMKVRQTAQVGAAAGGMARPGGMQVEGQLQEVTIGISNETYVEIVSGLEDGDSVLVPLPQGTVGTASSQTQTGIPGGFGGIGGMQFPAGGMGGGGGGFAGGAGSARGQGGGQ